MHETREFQPAVIELAERLGWRIYHVSNVKRHLRSKTSLGFPDLVMVRPPRILFAELKSETGKLTEQQEYWLRDLKDCHLEVYVWRPEDWPETIQNILRPIRRNGFEGNG